MRFQAYSYGAGSNVLREKNEELILKQHPNPPNKFLGFYMNTHEPCILVSIISTHQGV